MKNPRVFLSLPTRVGIAAERRSKILAAVFVGFLAASSAVHAQAGKELEEKYEQEKQKLTDQYAEALRKLRSDLVVANDSTGVKEVEGKLQTTLSASFDAALEHKSYVFRDGVMLSFSKENLVNDVRYRITAPREMHFEVNGVAARAVFSQDWKVVTFTSNSNSWMTRLGDQEDARFAEVRRALVSNVWSAVRGARRIKFDMSGRFESGRNGGNYCIENNGSVKLFWDNRKDYMVLIPNKDFSMMQEKGGGSSTLRPEKEKEVEVDTPFGKREH